MKITVVGGGGVRTPQLVNGLLAKSRQAEIEQITLLDIDQGKLELMSGVIEELKQEHPLGSKVTIQFTADREQAFRGADFIFFTIRVGGIESRIIDEQVPLKHGVIGQETTGPGGMAMALRTIPVMLDYMQEIREIAPEAWVLNLSNPAGLITQALIDAGYKKVIGICDSPSGLIEDIAHGLDLPREELWFDYFGLNHLGWIRQVKYRDRDITDRVLNNDQALKRHGRSMIPAGFIRKIGLIPNEYLLFYYQNTRVINKVSGSGKSRAQLIKNLNQRLFSELEQSTAGPLTLYQRYVEARHSSYMQMETEGFNDDDIAESLWQQACQEIDDGSYIVNQEPGGYAAIALSVLTAICGLQSRTLILNTQNQGAISCLEETDVVEIPVLVDQNGIHGITSSRIPEHARGLLQTVKSYERLTISASRKQSYSRALEALIIHPLVPDALTATRILDQYLEHHGDYFPELQA